ncbi:hypothetical protein [Cryptosporidium parvum Iowa II]|uniref:Uncharacterized protein n=2 Tax=Cryptosporidium parvum TaxID=5807 RepID=Q5CQ29_CRYPI|nr:hypothetical protein [Cryptosporidium parvum Iowa II]EAK87582.1 hypothetical protein cgd5_4350 [Cryptosporidium parvum Iowa II]QOY41757.1 Uncharacterized protein CPATCC_0025060 [Cryptosporidium parvum]WKS77978.1 hypothetical protein CPCDC_5g4350 [Cryptosporidium sp. 43IA8]WRK32469.1 Uncharacterized protein cpbgf_5004350 [Cryptosporidium parvum]|eukprot:QOY41757.1 hypothetical protein CPATCC_002353 [Cryptosporidium parvum]
MHTKRKRKSDTDQPSEPNKFMAVDGQITSNVFNDWNTEISVITERYQDELATKVSRLYEGIGKDLEATIFDYSQNEDEYILGLLKNTDIENNIQSIIDCLENYKESLNSKKRNHEGGSILEDLRKNLLKSYSRIASHKFVKDGEFVIKDWTYFLPILLSSSVSDIEISIILDKLPKVIRFLIKTIRKFQFITGKCVSVEAIDTINMYRNILNEFTKANKMYHNIQNISIERSIIEIHDPLTLYIKNIINYSDKTKLSSSFIPLRFGKDHTEGAGSSKTSFKLDLLSNSGDILYMIYGNNISSLGVFGTNYLSRKMNLDNLWQLSIFKNQSIGLILSNHKERDDKSQDFEIENLDSFIGSLGYGYSSLDSLKPMNPRPELNKRISNNMLRLQISKKVYKRYNKEVNPNTKAISPLSLNPLIQKFTGFNSVIEDEQKFGFRDYSKFPSIPNKEPERAELIFSNGAKLQEEKVPLGFISTIRQQKYGKRELELVILDTKECSNYIANQHKASKARNLRFEEYGLFWKTIPEKNGNYNFKMIPLRTCSASIHHSTKFKSHLYYSRFLLEQLVNSNWKKRIITKNKKYYKLSSLVNGGFLSKSQKETVNKITKIILNNGLWENYSDIVPKLLTGTDKRISGHEIEEWEDFDENNEFDQEMYRLSSECRNSSSSKSSEFYGKYLKLSSKNYKLVSKRCQKMLAKYIFKEYPRFLTQYFKIRKEWKEYNRSETQKRNKQNVNNSSRLQLDIIGYSGEKNLKAQFSNFENLKIKHEPNELKTENSKDPQVLHLIKLEKKQEQNTLTVLPKFDSKLPLNQIYKLENFISIELFNKIKMEWTKSTVSIYSGQLSHFSRILLNNLNNSSILNIKVKSFFLKLIIYIDWLIYLINHSNKSFGGARAIQKCLQASLDSQTNNQNSKYQSNLRIPIEFCNWIIDSFLSKYQTENLQTRFSFSTAGESKLFATILWLSNFVNAHSHNINYTDYNGDNFDIPVFLPSSEPSPIEFSDLLLQDLKDKFTKKFRSIAHAMGFRSTVPPPRRFKSKNYMIPPNITSVILNEFPRL